MALQNLPVPDAWSGEFASMLISRKLSHQVRNRLTVIKGLVQLGNHDRACARIDDLVELINAHVETREDEKSRNEREREQE
jgi:sensor histidine kinase regulating citrate/malate metabolism